MTGEITTAQQLRAHVVGLCREQGLTLRWLDMEANGRWYFRAQAWALDRLVANVRGYVGMTGLVIQSSTPPETSAERTERIARRWQRQGGA